MSESTSPPDRDRVLNSLDPFGRGPMHWDIDGNPVTMRQWARLMERKRRKGYGRIGRDEFRGVTVSTVWLGLDHGFGRGDTPIIFETMVFGGRWDDETFRYATKGEAAQGHRALARIVLGHERRRLRSRTLYRQRHRGR